MQKNSFILGLSATILSLFVTLIVLEILLQILPTQSYMPIEAVTKETTLLRYKPNIAYTYSAGWDFDAYNTGKTNAQGFISNYDYTQRSEKPLIAVIGDSYVEARMVPFEQTFHGLLYQEYQQTHRIYNFAIGGAPLSQYLAYAKHVRDTYNPQFMIFNIISNDFDESLPQYKNKPRFHYFLEDGQENLTLALIGSYKPSWMKETLSRSALIRYLYFHLRLSQTYNKILFWQRSNNATKTDHSRIEDSKKVIDAFFELLPSYTGLPPNRVLLIIDGHRSQIYGDIPVAEDYFMQMRNRLIEKAKSSEYSVLDMHPVFEEDFEKNTTRFEFEQDFHWNAYAHRLVSEKIQNHPTFQSYLNR